LITILHAEEIKAKFHDLLARIRGLAEQYHPDVIGVEDTTFQVWAGQELVRTTSLPIKFVRPSKKSGDFIGGSSKEYRFVPVAAKYHAKLIRHLSTLPPAFENQLFQFPAVDHDDMVDALVIAVSLITKEQDTIGAFADADTMVSPIGLDTTKMTCGTCSWFNAGHCDLRRFTTHETELGCPEWVQN
jgi:phage terminase large subunit-like protein